jgi:two-component system chemotaxis sensor kinase CheA
MQAELCAKLKKLGDKIATELVFAEAGKDMGLLPVNSLLGQIEDCASGPECAALREGIQQARGWVNDIFASSGPFSAHALKQFTQWAEWWQQALIASETEAAVPSLPQVGPAPAATRATECKIEEVAAVAEPTLLLNLEQDAELLGEFINESQEHLQNIEQGVLKLEQQPNDAETLDSIFRAFHTFKGGSGFLNLTAIQNLAHDLESLLDSARQHKLAITPPVINLILEGGDLLRRFTTEISAQLSGSKPPGPITVPTQRIIAEIKKTLSGEMADASRTEIKPPAVAPAHVAPSSVSVSNLIPEAVPVIPSAAIPSAPLASGAEPGAASHAPAPPPVVKVDTVKLDSLVDLVGEMLIAQSLVMQNKDLNPQRSEQLNRDLAQFGRISKELQRTVMSLRMVPVRSTFQKMNRLVRDLSVKVGKQVELVTEGEDTELDRTIVEELSDPLVHMIRNSVDHGIELPDVRLQKGKPAHGTVKLKAFHQGGSIVIEIKDDGAGLDRERIFAKAVEKGILKAEERPPENELFNLIMAPGFSTAEKITDISGRGVGMDVVRRNIEKLRGKIEIKSEPGRGSIFSIHLPLTLAIIDGFLVGVGEERYVLPTLLVREAFRPRPDMIHAVRERGEMVNLRGKLYPLIRLYAQLGVTPTTREPGQSIAVMVEAGSELCCFLVDQLLGKHEVVIKSLGETFRRNKYLAGGAILGDGRVGLILDPLALVRDEASPLEAAA